MVSFSITLRLPKSGVFDVHAIFMSPMACGGPLSSTSLEKLPTSVYARGVRKPKVETEDHQNTWHRTIQQVVVTASPDADEWLWIRQTESNSCGHTPKIDLNIAPSCQMSAQNGQYGISNSISGAGSLPYCPVHTPSVGSPVTTLDDGSESRSNVTANSKSLMKYRIGKQVRNSAQSCLDQFVPSGWLIPPAKLMRMFYESLVY
jgi:hypothetical protein